MRLSSSLLAVPVALAAAVLAPACSSSSPAPEPAEKVANLASPIINGNVDTTHQAVVALLLQKGNQQGVCSGTIIKTDPASGVGWVLTAAHCVNDIPPILAFQANDFASPTALTYQVLDYVADPGYSGETASPHDFGMVRILGVDASTPTIPLATAPDGLASGSPVVSVGYGRTTLIASGDTDTNTQRRNVSKTLNTVTTSSIGYDMSTKGICQGDSGGPVLVTSGGVEKVAGVHSYVEGDCDGEGYSGRVTYASSFINGQLAAAAPKRDCNVCTKIVSSGAGTCAQLTADCLADTQCAGLNSCLSKGTARATCLKQFPKGEGPFQNASNCACNQGCKAECGSTSACKNVPKCGFDLPAGDCATCSEGACCDATAACAADGECFVCLKNGDADPGCATNTLRKAMATCVASKCNAQCADTGLATGADPVVADDAGAPAPGAGTTTVTKSGCAVTATVPGGTSRLGYLAILGVVATLARRRSRRPAR
ncbi:MAG: hypothetical protein JWP97_3939 [Labilithrix sp.]|nr:hypothetical protein [Labilithrix sp.]